MVHHNCDKNMVMVVATCTIFVGKYHYAILTFDIDINILFYFKYVTMKYLYLCS